MDGKNYFEGRSAVLVSTGSPLIFYDTTLRDGSQRQDCMLGIRGKLEATRILSEFGFPYLEGGFVDSDEVNRDYFRRVRKEAAPASKVAVFGRTCMHDAEQMKRLSDYGINVFTLVGKSNREQVIKVLHKKPGAYLKEIERCAHMLAEFGEVIYDAEFFFPAFKAEKEYAVDTLRAAKSGGSKTLVLCDTTGMMHYSDIPTVLQEVAEEFGMGNLGVHFHNDRGLALPCTLEAIKAGVRHVQGTVNGYGERCGNADLFHVLGNLYEEGTFAWPKLDQMVKVSRKIEKLTGMPVPPNMPYYGRYAFAHCAGMHSDAQLKLWMAYQRLEPAIFGNKAWYPLSSQSGRAIVISEAAKYGFDVADNEKVGAVLSKVKEAGEMGDAQFLSLLQETFRPGNPLFTSMERRVIDSSGNLPLATVKMKVGEKTFLEPAEGDGPVNAMDLAFKKALSGRYPSICNLELADYEVHVIPGEHGGTAAMVRVFAEFRANGESFTSIARGEDILVASQKILEDAYRFYLIKTRTK